MESKPINVLVAVLTLAVYTGAAAQVGFLLVALDHFLLKFW
jgi:hypothetical protein